MSLRTLLFGKYGQLGWELERSLACLGPLTAIDYPEVNFTRPELLTDVVLGNRPDLIVNAIAYTDVDRAESEADKARLVNATSVGVLAEQALKLGVPFIHYSTDYVFDGTKGTPYVESDPVSPLNVYGQTKREGEVAVSQVGGAWLVLRTSWVYSLRKGGFVNKVLDWAQRPGPLRIVDDQVANPTWARMLAECTALLIAGLGEPAGQALRRQAGLYHLAGDGACSRYEWARAILDMVSDPQTGIQVLPVPSSEFPTPASRPSTSALDCRLFADTFHLQLPPWQASLRQAMAAIQEGQG